MARHALKRRRRWSWPLASLFTAAAVIGTFVAAIVSPHPAQAATNATAAYNYFIAKGLTDYQSAGIVGNLILESGVNPASVQTNGAGRGIAQWSAGGRWDTSPQGNVVAFAAQLGTAPTDLQTQLDFIWLELPRYGLTQLRATGNVTDATIVFQNVYEVCGGCNQAQRIAQAQQALATYQVTARPPAGAAGPTAVSWGPQRIDVFVEGTDNHLWQNFYGNGGWSWALPVGDAVTSAPAVASWGPDRLDVFARGQSGDLIHFYYDKGWHRSESLGGVIAGQPAAVASANGVVNVFVRGTDGRLWQNTFVAATNTWTWTTPGNLLVRASPSVSSWGGGRIDLFLQGTSGDLVHVASTDSGKSWTDRQSLGGGISGQPAATSWGTGRIDVFVQGTDGRLWQAFYNGSSWNWALQTATISSTPAASSWGPGRLDVFARGAAGELTHTWYDETWHTAVSNGGLLQ